VRPRSSVIVFRCVFHSPKGAKTYPTAAQLIIHVTAAHWGTSTIVFRPSGMNIPANQRHAMNALRPNDCDACPQYSRR